ncbi:MAG: DNA recombination protein RmuC, partial [Gammaproteobacteria bacterium]|nr:DNA recombination protein RmuC [Gammaproteobacteria bacterium]
MEQLPNWLAVVFPGIAVLLLLLVIRKLGQSAATNIDETVRNEFRHSRNESGQDSKRLREEVSRAQKSSTEALIGSVTELGKSQQQGLGAVEKRIAALVESNENRLNKLSETLEKRMGTIQAGNETKIEKMQAAVTKAIEEMKNSQQESFSAMETRVKSIAESNEKRLDKLRETVDVQLNSLQERNEKKLDQMRQTVDEKLQSTLEKRLGESFKLVSERLEAVQRGLGDMQNLATGVGDLKRMLTNVKARGTWGEFQLGDILEQILTPDQFEKNVQPKAGSSETVEYAVRL